MNKAAVAIILALMSPSGVAAEPKVLAESELDSITAAGVLIDVASVAEAMGDFADSRTSANTFMFGGKHLDLGVGVTMGEALSCCGEDAHVAVGSSVLGIGDFVHGVTHTVRRDSPVLARGLSVGLVLAVSYDKHFATVQDQRAAILKELRAALANFQMDVPGIPAHTE